MPYKAILGQLRKPTLKRHMALRSLMPQASGTVFGKVCPYGGVTTPGRTDYHRIGHHMTPSLYLVRRLTTFFGLVDWGTLRHH